MKDKNKSNGTRIDLEKEILCIRRNQLEQMKPQFPYISDFLLNVFAFLTIISIQVMTLVFVVPNEETQKALIYALLSVWAKFKWFFIIMIIVYLISIIIYICKLKKWKDIASKVEAQLKNYE